MRSLRVVRHLPLVYPRVPFQLCWAHKARNITDKVRRKDREIVKRHIQRIYLAPNRLKARKAAGRFKTTWEDVYPAAVACLYADLPDLLHFLKFKDDDWRKTTRTTNAIERRFKEVRCRTRPMGVFFDRCSVERILYAVFTYEKIHQGSGPLFALTHNS